MRLLICAGGTGGGVYPALAVWTALAAEPEAHEVLWVGGAGGIEAELVARAGIPFRAIPAAGVHGVGLRALPGNLARLVRGLGAARQVLAEFRPHGLLFTGGYVGAPLALAARFTRRRGAILVYAPDIEPGFALRFLASAADGIALSAEAGRAYYPGNREVRVTGYPARAELQRWAAMPDARAEACRRFGLQAGRPTLLVFGGSLGARSLNLATLGNLAALLEVAQVIHILGTRDWEAMQTVRANLSVEQTAGYHAFPYLHEDMGAALAAADLVVSRAGASCLGEFPLFGLPAVLAPYPHAWRYQQVNAAFLEKHSAAVILPDAELQDQLAVTVRGLLTDTPRLTKMRAAMQSLAKADAAGEIGRWLAELAAARANERR